MNNLQYIIKDDTRAAMHMAVELCEQGDFDSPYEAVHWLMQEHDDTGQENNICEWIPVESCHTFAGPGWECSNCGHEVGEYEHDFYNCCPICCAKVMKR